MGSGPIWLRTCYTPSLAGVYDEIFRGCEEDAGASILDDVSLYTFGEAWDRIFFRLPSLGGQHNGIDLCDTESWQPPEEEFGKPLWDAGTRATEMIYLIDRHALEEKLLTVLWIDCHGEFLWWYKVKTEHLQSLTGNLSDSGGLWMWADTMEEGIPGVFEKGALIDWVD
jgi:hypothetical protein